MKGRRTVLVLVLAGMCLVAGAAVLGVTSIPDWRLKVLAAAAAAMATFGAGIVPVWLTAVVEKRHQYEAARAQSIFMIGGKPPLVQDISDALSTGVHASARGARGDRIPPYVLRDADPALRQALNHSGFVLLSGAAAVGKTRTAFEAIRAVLPHHVFISPKGIAEVPEAMRAAGQERHCVLWLDNLQRYLGGSAISSAGIAELLSGKGHHRVVVATLRAAEESRLIAMAGSPSGGQLMRDGQAVLDLADRIVIERMFTTQERERVASLAIQDARLASALRHANEYGIAEYLSSGPQLHTEWENAWERGAHPRGAALIAAAVDCRLAGFAAPLSRSLLDELHQEYLDRGGGMRLRPEPLNDAWAWATQLRDSGNSPLWLGERDSYHVFDYLVDVLAARQVPVPESTVRTALRFADSADALVIGATAWYQGRRELAVAGFRRTYAELRRTKGPDEPATLASRSDLAVTLYALGRLPDAETEYREILDRRTAILGPHHPDTLASRNNLAVLFHHERRLAEAEAEYRAVLSDRTRALGPEHPDTLVTRNNLGVVLMHTGRLDEAEAELKQVVELREQVLGPDHPVTEMSRGNLETVRRMRLAQ